MLKVSICPVFPQARYQNTRNVSFKSQSGLINCEMEMIPKLLELAANKKGFDRFNSLEIQGITQKFADYVSGMYKPDFLKGLLAIGNERGEMLSFAEINAILSTTSELTSDEQNNIIRFVKYLKEREYPEYNAEYIIKNHTFEKYKKDLEKIFPEGEIEKAYQNILRNELNMVSSAHHREYLSKKAPKIDKYFGDEYRRAIKNGVAKSGNPEVLAEIMLEIGMHPSLATMAEPLVKAYEMSKGNMGFVLDMAYSFTSKEALEILDVLKKEKSVNLAKYSPVYVSQIYERFIIRNMTLNSARKDILEELGLTGKVKCAVVPPRELDIMEAKKRCSGSFEQGKRR